MGVGREAGSARPAWVISRLRRGADTQVRAEDLLSGRLGSTATPPDRCPPSHGYGPTGSWI